MKKYILLGFIITLLSCSKEEGLEYIDSFIDNQGYMPVAPNNTWLYETWQANLSKDGSYDYEGQPTNTTNTITNLRYNETKKEVTYELSPYPIRLLGTILGNFDKITKSDNKYFREAKLDLSNGGTDFSMSLNGSVFIDEKSKVGDLLHSETNIFRSKLVTPIDVKYSLKTYMTGRYDKLPTYLTNKEGIDSHLAEYSDIIKVTDSIIIDELILGLNSLSVNLDMFSDTTGFGAQNIGAGKPGTTSMKGAISIELFPGLTINQDIDTKAGDPPGDTSLDITIKAIDVPFCKTTSHIDIKETISLDFKIISNDIPIVIDNYYAKGVGKIKTVTNIEQINGVVKVDEFKAKPYKLDIVGEPESEECKNKPEAFFNDITKKSSYTVEFKIAAMLNGLLISIPFSGGIKSDLIQNLKAYSLRKSLN
ncbi:MAG: hypothetical protein ACEQSF_04170 [Solirubrobacteraceae bacterium]